MHIVHDCIHIAFHLGIGHGKQGIGAVHKCCAGTQCDQGVHVRRTVKQALETADEKLPVDDHNNNGKQHLHQSHGNMVAVEKAGQRPVPHHVSHGNIHQNRQESHRGDQTLFQHRGIVIFQRRLVGRCGL